MLKQMYSYLFLFVSLFSVSAGEAYIHHELEISVKPSEKYIEVLDRIEFPSPLIPQDVYFLLHGNLNVSASSADLKIQLVEQKPEAEFFGIENGKFEKPEKIPYKLYKISLRGQSEKPQKISLTYKGIIHHPVEKLSKEYARGFSETPGIISDEGVYLAGSSNWLPWFNNDLVTFNLSVTIEPGWRVVSQGRRTEEEVSEDSYQVRWESPEPMEEVFLIAAKFVEYRKQIGNVNVLAFLRTADESLANKYLETTAQYLDMYNQLIGLYPYSKFALVENFWETGYGMPSFTLLGQKVIRFPFILHSSYPHELLHNWWGNSVFVDYETGNWCEGLTVFMADHLIKEQRGQGAEYRRGSLQAYTNYVNDANEFTLREFLSRNDAPSSAIGYNKSMMLFNMLRQNVGDNAFVEAIQRFYRGNKFRKAGFGDIRTAFEEVSGRDLTHFFDQWVNQKGAPVLEIAHARATKKDDGYYLTVSLSQTQKGPVYQLSIPVAVYLEGEKQAAMENLAMDMKEQVFDLKFKKRPLGIDIDPEFDVFRKLDRNEIPPALSQVFGAEKVTIVLPSEESKNLLDAYKDLAQNWTESDPDMIEIVRDKDLKIIPRDRALWLFGLNNKFKKSAIEALSEYDIDITDSAYRIGKSTVSPSGNSIILSTQHPLNPAHVMVWLSADNEKAMPGLGRKLPHYGKYSYLVFEGDEPTNILKGQWPAVNSPLSATLSYSEIEPAAFEKGQFPARKALATLAPVFSEERILAHVKYLAGEELEGRGLGSAGLEKAAAYIASEFKKAGLKPGGDENSFFQVWQDKGGKENKMMTLKNVVGVIPGKKTEWTDQSLVVCAHYDHLGFGWPDVREGNEGRIHYGADDNASGVAVLLELAKLLGKNSSADRTIIFIAFTAEESGLRGSRFYVKNSKKYPAKKIMGAINLDTIGRLGKNKILILSSSSASEWKHIARGIGFVTGIEYELVSQDLDASDQVSFFNAGVPAVQIFSGANRDYHRPSDRVDKIDSAGMVKIATFTREAIVYLAEREDPMTFTGAKVSDKTHPPSAQKRKAGTGIMPDFAFQGKGVRAAEVPPDSPAAKAGLQKGDVIIKLGEQRVENLREYSNALKKYQPGDTTMIVFLHEGKEIESKITLKGR
jgi:aminopeptidase N